MVHEFFGFRPLYADLTHVADIEHAYFLTDRVMLFCDSLVLDRHVIACKGRHQRAQIHMPVMKAGGFDLLFHVYEY